MSDTTNSDTNPAYTYALAVRETMERLAARLNGERVGECHECGETGDECTCDPFDTLAAYPLAVEVRRTLSVLVTFGGPHAELLATLDDDGEPYDARLVVSWGSDTSTVRGTAIDTLAAHYAPYVAGE